MPQDETSVSEAEVEAALPSIYVLADGCRSRGPCKKGARPVRGCMCRSMIRAALTAAAQVRERARVVKPTIEELEAILREPTDNVRINPDGSVTTLEPDPGIPTSSSGHHGHTGTTSVEPDSGPDVLGMRKEEE